MFSFIISYGQLVKIFFRKFCYLFDTVIIAEKKSDATWLVLIYNVKWIRKLLKALAKIFPTLTFPVFFAKKFYRLIKFQENISTKIVRDSQSFFHTITLRKHYERSNFFRSR